jgi:hypothetical protein
MNSAEAGRAGGVEEREGRNRSLLAPAPERLKSKRGCLAFIGSPSRRKNPPAQQNKDAGGFPGVVLQRSDVAAGHRIKKLKADSSWLSANSLPSRRGGQRSGRVARAPIRPDSRRGQRRRWVRECGSVGPPSLRPHFREAQSHTPLAFRGSKLLDEGVVRKVSGPGTGSATPGETNTSDHQASLRFARKLKAVVGCTCRYGRARTERTLSTRVNVFARRATSDEAVLSRMRSMNRTWLPHSSDRRPMSSSVSGCLPGFQDGGSRIMSLREGLPRIPPIR